MKTAEEQYVTLKRFDHYGEHGVVLKQGELCTVWMLDCKHGVTKLDIIREDI